MFMHAFNSTHLIILVAALVTGQRCHATLAGFLRDGGRIVELTPRLLGHRQCKFNCKHDVHLLLFTYAVDNWRLPKAGSFESKRDKSRSLSS